VQSESSPETCTQTLSPFIMLGTPLLVDSFKSLIGECWVACKTDRHRLDVLECP
jgi:hypothetical protein